MRLFFALIIVVISCGCSSFVEVKKPEKIADYIAAVEEHNQRIKQIKASLDIKAHGVMAGFLHEQADVVMQAPHYMYWSIRSFFGPPSIIVASNGEYLTAYDFTGQNPQPYQRTPLFPETFVEFMDFRLHPSTITNLFLQRIPLENARDLQLNVKGEYLDIRALLDGGWVLHAIFDVALRRVVAMDFRNEALNIEYFAKYQNFQKRSGILFPASFVLTAKGKSRTARLQIEFTHIELNGQLVLPDVFYVKPH